MIVWFSSFQHNCNIIKMTASAILDQYTSPRETLFLCPQAVPFDHNCPPTKVFFFDDAHWLSIEAAENYT